MTGKATSPTRPKDAPRRPRQTTTYGFAQTGGLLAKRMAGAAQSRGFSQMRLVTHWPEIVGAELAALCAPVRVTFGKGGLGGTLIVRTTGALAPAVDMSRETLRARVNTCYGYNAIARIRIEHGPVAGFAQPQAPFAARPKRPTAGPAAPAGTPASTPARAATQTVTNPDLRAALERLGQNVAQRSAPSRLAPKRAE